MPERKLKIGAIVETRLVPPYAMSQIKSNYEVPPPPKVGIKSAAGHTEYKDAPSDSLEWQEYSAKLIALQKKADANKEDFSYDYAIKRWSWDGGATWETEPPEDWQFPELFTRYGLKSNGNRRADYIRYEMLQYLEDLQIVSSDSLGKTIPISDREVDAALGNFRSDIQGRKSARERRKAKR